MQNCDVSVIGGGIAGIGAAIACAQKGLKVRLFERHQLCSATSANSLRIIHGGIRYLQSLDIARTLESIRAQEQLLRLFPKLIRRLPCLMPLTKGGMRSYLPASVAIKLYDFLGKRHGRVKSSRILKREFFDRYHPDLAKFFPFGALLWYDARIVDLQKFNLALRDCLNQLQIEVLENFEIKRVARKQDEFILSNSDLATEYKSSSVINCAGAWLNSIKKENIEIGFRNDSWCRAFNLVVGKQISDRFAIGLHSRAGRLLFFVPRDSCTAIGTGYLPWASASDPFKLANEELGNFISDINQTIPGWQINSTDIISLDLGILPCKGHNSAGEPNPQGRSVITENRGYFELLSTKYTTFLTQVSDLAAKIAAQRAVRK